MNSASISLIWQQHIINATQPCLYDFFFVCFGWELWLLYVTCTVCSQKKNYTIQRLYKV